MAYHSEKLQHRVRKWLQDHICLAYSPTLDDVPEEDVKVHDYSTYWCGPKWSIGVVHFQEYEEVHVYISDEISDADKMMLALTCSGDPKSVILLSERFKGLIAQAEKRREYISKKLS